MSITQITGCVLLLSAVVTACSRSCVLCVPEPNPSSKVSGSLILHYQDNSTHRIEYDSNTHQCRKDNLPNKKIAKVEVNSAEFILYSKNQWRGTMATVVEVGNTEFSPEEINGIKKVKSVRQKGCRAWKLR